MLLMLALAAPGASRSRNVLQPLIAALEHDAEALQSGADGAVRHQREHEEHGRGGVAQSRGPSA